MRMNWIVGLVVMACIALPQSFAQEDTDQPAGDAKAADAIAEAIKQINEQDNGITVNRENRYVDVQATVCLRKGEFLEMFACTKDTREHESILVVNAVPSTMHLGLLLLGLEPGKPLSYDRDFDPPKLVPAEGPEVDVFIVLKVDNVEREVPANRWVQDSKTKKMKEGNTWVFAGSQFVEFRDKEVYQADLNGSAISLVNFGDDLLTLPHEMTDANESHGKVWVPRTQAIPKVGTKVVIRLRPKPVDEAEDADGPEAAPAAKDGE